MALYLGIDGGGTKTSCVVANETSILGSATTAGSNITRHGESRVRAALLASVAEACAAAKVDAAQIASACVGLSGAGRPEVRNLVADIMRERLGGLITVVSDLETTLQAAFHDGPGVIVISGTGSIAYGRNSRGQTARAGGWGLAISDEGSGQWIGRTAVSAVLGAKDAGEDPPLLASILKLWKLGSVDELVRHANASPPPDFSSLFRPVVEAASAGDSLAGHLLEQAGAELSALARNVIRRLSDDAATVPVAMSGGVFRQSERVRRVFYNKLTGECPQAKVHPDLAEPVKGALEIARKAAVL